MSKNYIYEINNFFIDLRDISVIGPINITNHYRTCAAEGSFIIYFKNHSTNNLTLNWSKNYQSKGYVTEKDSENLQKDLHKIIIEKRTSLIVAWMEAINNQ